ncbi:hypothetical protein O1611_g1042 [Lasiodiplodia mahajangana]|uniref:Uncharacterized protein n=1 Tax=Lasiodiplodia mahajangana TaxID=1108764 RepID=A0ACC2JYI5_9PEZI|nr:hypothetical protein O1611_g1042 [Lasiodiplodia mahajangana]
MHQRAEPVHVRSSSDPSSSLRTGKCLAWPPTGPAGDLALAQGSAYSVMQHCLVLMELVAADQPASSLEL